jgi:hypothetical protein
MGAAWVAICTRSFPFGTVVTAVIDLVDNNSVARYLIHIRDISFGLLEYPQVDIAVIELDCKPAIYPRK